MAENKPTETREARFLKLWSQSNFDPLAKSGCAVEAGYSKSGANGAASRAITNLIQNKKMQKQLKKAGVDMKRLAEKINELLDAKHPLSNRDMPDNFVQLKAAELGVKLHDAFAPTRVDVDKTETKQIIFSAEVIQRLERYNDQRQLLEAKRIFDVSPVPTDQG